MQRKWRRDWERGKTNYRKDGLLNPFKKLAKSILPPMAAAGILLGGMTGAYANAILPAGGEIVGGTGTISQNGSTMTINQATDRMVANWKSFSIGAGGKVVFNQQGVSSVALNRVLGNDASNIYGQLIANGKVFLVNPNGVLFAPGAQVNVGGLVASTLNISDSDFMAKNYTFIGNDNSGPVTNQATITTADGGYVAFLAPEVINDGIIVAQKGTVALGAGQVITLDMHGDRLLSLAVDQAALDASAANHNLIQTDGGQVIIAARAANTLARTVVNNSGVIRARSISNTNGEIILGGGPKGAVVNSGTLDASGKKADETGGAVKVLGDEVTLTGTAKVDVSGAEGGGTALIGGNYQGKGPEQNATATTVAEGASINADATVAGNGGNVVVWADDTTNYYGNISTRGGASGGDGGSAEVSGQKTLLYKGYTDLRAPRGITGTLLLDPREYTISTGATGGNIYNVTELGNQLNAANVTLQTDGSGTGNITVAADVTNWTSGNTLSLRANNDINVNAAVKCTGNGNVELRADSDADSKGMVNFGTSGKVTTDGTVSIYYNPSGTTATTINGVATTVKDYNNPTDYAKYVQKTAGGAGNLTAYMLVNSVNELQAVTNNLTGVYALGKDIDARGTCNWNSGAGFVPIGDFTSFAGILDGGGHVVNGLYINVNASMNPYVGLFTRVGGNGATIRNLGLKNVSITSGVISGYVGGLAGEVGNATITNCYVTGTVNGNASLAIGGLAGSLISGNVTNSYSAATVQGTNPFSEYNVGSLIGTNEGGSIDKCYATGSVIGSGLSDNLNMGGLVGYNSGSIKNSYSMSAVTVNSGQWKVGGLVGWNFTGSSIENCYSTGAVIGNFTSGGGLVGINSGQITSSYSTGAVTGSGTIGGLVGWTSGSVVDSYSAGKVTGSEGSTVGGFVGEVDTNGGDGKVIGSYWDKDTSGQQSGIGAIFTPTGMQSVPNLAGLTGLAGSSPFIKSSYKGWNFSDKWYMIDGSTRPFLQSEYSTTITNAHQLQLMAKDLSAHYTLAGNIDMNGYKMARSGFIPIGSSSTPFIGALSGNGYAVNGLSITSPVLAEVGLFGNIKNAAISNVGLYDVNIAGGVTGDYVGSLVGYNNGGSITNVYSTGIVSGQGAVGGLVGLNDGQITTSYTISQVAGIGKVGGLVGENYRQITNSYSTGQVTGDAGSAVGGFIGANGGDSTVTGSYWDKETSAQVKGVGGGSSSSPGLTGLTTAQMMDKNYLTNGGFDFTKTWFMIDGSTRPFLRSENVAIITNAHQLQLMAANLKTDYTLGSSVGMSELSRASGMWNTTTGFASVGSSDAPFTGTLNGAGYTINGLRINKPAAAAVGLFSYIKDATISSIGLCDVNITGGADNTYVGSLVGYNEGGSIFDTYITGNVSGVTTVGGLVGLNNGSIMNSYNAGTVSGTGNLGGLAGINDGSIANSYNKGMVATVAGAGIGSKVGGLAGTNNGAITNSYNAAGDLSTGTAAGMVNGNVAKDIIGGLAGENAGEITGSYNAGIVNANDSGSIVGGLAGENTGAITGSYNNGEVTANATGSKVGGLAGINTGDITGSYNAAADFISGAGTVIGNAADTIVGGLVGENAGTITDSYNNGVLTANYQNTILGGLAGINKKMITGSYNTSAITASADHNVISGLAGRNYGSITKSYNSGALTSDAAANAIGGLVGENAGGSIDQSYNSGAVTTTVKATDNWAGGLAGKNSGAITGSYNAAVVIASGAGSRVGGLVGLNASGGSITNSYNGTYVVTTSGDNNITGGLVGENDGSIVYAYAISPVTATGSGSTAGALVGLNGSTGTISNSYWNTEIAGQPKGVGSGSTEGVQGLTIAGMMQRSNYPGWDLSNTWGIADGVSFPYLAWQFDGTPQFISGKVQGGGIGKTVDILIYTPEYYYGVNRYLVGTAQATTVALNGFYYITVPSYISIPNDGLLVLGVTGDSNYKANSVYRCGNSGLFGGNLAQNTLIVNCGSAPLRFEQIPAGLSVDDSIYSMDGRGNMTVRGDLQGRNLILATDQNSDGGGNLTVTGSITINNPADEYVWYRHAKGPFLELIPAMSDTETITSHISAGGDITYITGRNLFIQALKGQFSYYKDGKLTGGGDITLVTGSGFVNTGGADAIKAGSGRWVVYAPEQLLYPSEKLFAEEYQNRHLATGIYNPGSLWLLGSQWAIWYEQYLPTMELITDGRGGLTGDFTQWGTAYGQSFPATGSGFVYTALDPLIRPLTPSQVRRNTAITSAHTYKAKGRGTAAAPELTTATLPFLTITGQGVAFDAADAGQITAEQQTEPGKSLQDSDAATSDTGK